MLPVISDLDLARLVSRGEYATDKRNRISVYKLLGTSSSTDAESSNTNDIRKDVCICVD